MGWTSLTNGELLRQAGAYAFDAVLTADQNIEFQQNLKTLPVAVLVLVAASNRFESLVPLMMDVLRQLENLEPRKLVRVGVAQSDCAVPRTSEPALGGFNKR